MAQIEVRQAMIVPVGKPRNQRHLDIKMRKRKKKYKDR